MCRRPVETLVKTSRVQGGPLNFDYAAALFFGESLHHLYEHES